MKHTTRLAEQMQDTPGLMAGLILAYQIKHHLDDQALMTKLQIDSDGFARLLSARRPHPERKVQDVIHIAQTAGCDPAVLWSIINQTTGSLPSRSAPQSLLR